jgi:hypothetical protein
MLISTTFHEPPRKNEDISYYPREHLIELGMVHRAQKRPSRGLKCGERFLSSM